MGKVREGSEAILKAHQDRVKAAQTANAERETRAASGKPTPTPDECDMAKLGVLDIDSKDDDGSGPEMARELVLKPADRSMAADKPADYSTRTAGSAGSASGGD